MVKFCNCCGLEIHLPDTYFCSYCNVTFCIEHRLVEDHECSTAKKVSLNQKVQTQNHQRSSGSPGWMYGCLSIAKEIINKHHKNCSSFFSEIQIDLFIQSYKEHVLGYITGTFPHFKIGIHSLLSEQTAEHTRMVIIVLVHELLHLIHTNWEHDKIIAEQRRLASMGDYFDSLRNMEVLYLSGKMRLCDK